MSALQREIVSTALSDDHYLPIQETFQFLPALNFSFPKLQLPNYRLLSTLWICSLRKAGIFLFHFWPFPATVRKDDNWSYGRRGRGAVRKWKCYEIHKNYFSIVSMLFFSFSEEEKKLFSSKPTTEKANKKVPFSLTKTYSSYLLRKSILGNCNAIIKACL